MAEHSQNATLFARAEFRDLPGDVNRSRLHNGGVTDGVDIDPDDKNGGPNHLRAWRQFRKMKGAALARALGITPGMVSDLENSNRALSAKWLRRIAPVLETTPGFLLDYDPYDLPPEILEVWLRADGDQRRQLIALAKVIVPDEGRTGTKG